jgi:Phosphotransferase enzyme family
VTTPGAGIRQHVEIMSAAAEAVRASLGAATVEIVDVRPNPHASTARAEVVQCVVDGRDELALLLKWDENIHHPDDHRGPALAYEAWCYEHVLRDARSGTARMFGLLHDPATGSSVLLLEHVGGAKRCDENADVRSAMIAAARWAGTFHRRCEGRSRGRLELHDDAYFRQWAGRTRQYASPLMPELPWLPTLCSRFEDAVEELGAHDRTVVHGEFTPHNVLVAGDRVAPVDWECAALSTGEIDLASLTDRWPRDVVEVCESAYAEARWPGGTPAEFGRVLDLARCYWQFRWLGKKPAWTLRERSRWRFDELRTVATRLGLI